MSAEDETLAVQLLLSLGAEETRSIEQLQPTEEAVRQRVSETFSEQLRDKDWVLHFVDHDVDSGYRQEHQLSSCSKAELKEFLAAGYEVVIGLRKQQEPTHAEDPEILAESEGPSTPKGMPAPPSAAPPAIAAAPPPPPPPSKPSGPHGPPGSWSTPAPAATLPLPKRAEKARCHSAGSPCAGASPCAASPSAASAASYQTAASVGRSPTAVSAQSMLSPPGSWMGSPTHMMGSPTGSTPGRTPQFTDKQKNVVRDCKWLKVSAGRLALRARPSAEHLHALKAGAGATAVVTLLREDEPGYQEVSDACEQIGLRWVHAPLDGLRDLRDGDCTQKAWRSLRLVHEVVAWLSEGESVVVHCAAGLHRTGVFGYAVLRLSGVAAELVLPKIREMRPVTAEEVDHRKLDRTGERIYNGLLKRKPAKSRSKAGGGYGYDGWYEQADYWDPTTMPTMMWPTADGYYQCGWDASWGYEGSGQGSAGKRRGKAKAGG